VGGKLKYLSLKLIEGIGQILKKKWMRHVNTFGRKIKYVDSQTMGKELVQEYLDG
jgi:hypothetical protein